MKRTLATSLFVLLSGCATTPSDMPTQQGVDLQRYAGTWYEQARLPNRFQDDCVDDVKADYVLQADKTITVTNRCRTKDGAAKVAQGEGRLSNASTPRDPSKLEVRFAPKWTSWLPMVWGDYWILRLEGDYQYSLVGTPDRKYLWVLSRDQNADDFVVNELLDYARTLDFPVEQVTKSEK